MEMRVDPKALIGGAAAGASALYFFDPVAGRRRRARARDKTVHLTKVARRTASVTYRDALNRGRGLTAEARSLVSRRELDEEVLVDTVRSKLGQLVTHPRAIEVRAVGDKVILSGAVLADEVDGLLRGVSLVRGVSEVQNDLDVFKRGDEVPSLQGGGKRPRKLRKENWSPTTRALAMAGGAAMAYAGVMRGMRPRLALIGAGGALVARAATNLPLKRVTGVGAKRRGIDVQTAIHIDAPVEQVFSYWTDYANFPQWMTHVKDVSDLGQGRSRWTVEGPARIPIRYDAEISSHVPDERLGWRSAEGSAIKHSGLVEFSPTPQGGTRVHIRMTYNPVAGGIGHLVAELLGSDPRRRIEDDLVRLKTLIETGKAPSDAAQAEA